MVKKQISWILALALGAQAFLYIPAMAAEAGAEIYTAGISETDTSALGVDTVGFGGEEPYIVEDLDAYETMEILTMDQEGTVSVYSCDSKEEVGRKIGELSQEEGISLIQPNYRYEDQALAVNDASSGEQWALQNDGSFQMDERTIYPIYANPFGRPSHGSELLGLLVQVREKHAAAGVDINIEEAWAKYGNGTHDAIVAVIDTGIDAGHEDLVGAMWVNADEILGNGIDDDGNGYVDDVNGWNFYNGNNQIYNGQEDSHGTHGAGTIRASIGNGAGIAGIVPGNRVHLMALKALGGEDGDGSTASLIQAIRYAEENGAVICNLSLTTTVDDRAMYLAMANSSMLFVVAAGNGDSRTGIGLNTDHTPFYPAAYDLDNIISVANLSFDGNLHDSSNYGAMTVDLVAPGTYILSTTPGNTYSYMTGTSMAAPMVTGAAAMVYSYFDGIGPADVKEILLSTVTPMENLAGKTVTGGRLNVGAALSYDISRLSRSGFENAGHAPENGTAPLIETRSVDRAGGTYLQVRVVDIDGDLKTLLYAQGELTAEAFASGTAGEAFTVNENDVATFRVDHAGTYTFYAADSRGNQTVETVRFLDMSVGPGGM